MEVNPVILARPTLPMPRRGHDLAQHPKMHFFRAEISHGSFESPRSAALKTRYPVFGLDMMEGMQKHYILQLFVAGHTY